MTLYYLFVSCRYKVNRNTTWLCRKKYIDQAFLSSALFLFNRNTAGSLIKDHILVSFLFHKVMALIKVFCFFSIFSLCLPMPNVSCTCMSKNAEKQCRHAGGYTITNYIFKLNLIGLLEIWKLLLTLRRSVQYHWPSSGIWSIFLGHTAGKMMYRQVQRRLARPGKSIRCLMKSSGTGRCVAKWEANCNFQYEIELQILDDLSTPRKEAWLIGLPH